MCVLREKRVRDFFVFDEGQKTWQRAKKREKKSSFFESKKEAKKNKKHLKRRVKKERERHKKNFFSKTQTNSLLFLHFLSLEKNSSLKKRLRTHQEDFTKTL